ncbi:MAG: hypothetical protein ACE5HC_11130 [Candidatus Binatia bacterium]
MKLITDNQTIERRSEIDSFDDVTEAEIICLWHSFKATGLSEDQAWNAIVTGMALDMAFARSKNLPQADH